MKKGVVIAVLALTAVPLCRADVIPTYHNKGYADLVKFLVDVQKEIKQWSQVIGAAKQQIGMLGQVSDGIRQVKNLSSQTVKGLMGSLADAIGVDAIFKTLEATQKDYTDLGNLIKDVQELPDDAKRQLKDVGLSVKEVQDFLAHGLAYESMNSLGVEQWKAVGSNPMKALENGSFGMAIDRSAGYLDDKARGEEYARFLSNLPAKDREQMGVLMGPKYAAYLAENWYHDMDKRLHNVADTRNLSNKIAKVVDGLSDGGSLLSKDPTQESINESLATASAARDMRNKIDAEAARNRDSAAQAMSLNESERLKQLQRLQGQHTDNDTIQAIANRLGQ